MRTPSLPQSDTLPALATVFTGSNKVPPGRELTMAPDTGSPDTLHWVKTSKYPAPCHLRLVTFSARENPTEIWAPQFSLLLIVIICLFGQFSEIKRRWRRFMQEWGIIITTYWKLDSQTQSCKNWASDTDLAINIMKNNSIMLTGKTWRGEDLISDRWGDPSIRTGI